MLRYTGRFIALNVHYYIVAFEYYFVILVHLHGENVILVRKTKLTTCNKRNIASFSLKAI